MDFNQQNPQLPANYTPKSSRKKRINPLKFFIVSISCSILIFLFIFIFTGLIAGKYWAKHETAQEKKIDTLTEEISTLKKELGATSKQMDALQEAVILQGNPAEFLYSDTGFNYLAIGNSITSHRPSEYWWSNYGMAASVPEKDYVHLIEKYLKKKHDEVSMQVFNYYIWEVQSSDRAETYELLDDYLDKRLNLITIQLSENVTDLSTYENDYIELIHHIKSKAPNAQLIIIDDFWTKGKRASIKKNVAKTTKVSFASLEKIKGKKKYYCGIGTKVYGDDGKKHKVDHEGVSIHPGDKGMDYIAKAVIKHIRKK